MEIEKIIRMLAVFIVVAAFALSVAARLLFPEVSHLSDTPLLILLILSVCAIWRDALRSEKQTENTNEYSHEKTPSVRRSGGRSRLLRTQDGP